MLKLIALNFPALRNSEYPLVVNRIIVIVEAHKPEELRLKRSFDRLAAFRTQLDKIEVQERTDSYSARLHELDVERDTLLHGIRTTATAFRSMSVEAVSAPAARIMELFDKHGSDIAQDNYTAETKRVYDLLDDVKAMPDAEETMKAVSLFQSFERLAKVNGEFDGLFVERTQHQAETERVKVREIRLECDKAITKLWEAIEYNIDEHGEDEYAPLVAAINALNSYYRQQLTARASRRKAKQDVSAEESIEPAPGLI
jgi:hypothetical protein